MSFYGKLQDMVDQRLKFLKHYIDFNIKLCSRFS